MFNKIIIGSKDVFITEKHHHNLLPWANLRKEINQGLTIISLDHHLDLLDPFEHYSYDYDKMIHDAKVADVELSKMNFMDLSSIEQGIINLNNDEHIKTAIELNIIDKIFILNYVDGSDYPISNEIQKYNKDNEILILDIMKGGFSTNNTGHDIPKRPYTYPASNIYIIENLCWIGCNKLNHDDECQMKHFEQAIESALLKEKLNIMSQMDNTFTNNNSFNKEYILDIDLDYFHTRKSLHPTDDNIFLNLIKNAKSITISKEKEFINEWANICEYDKLLNVDYILSTLLEHIERACSK